VASFQARKNTATPAKAALIGVAVNLAVKVALSGTLAQAGLALGTAFGAWVNLLIVVVLAVRAKYMAFDRAMQLTLLKFALAAVLLAATLWATVTFGAPALLADVRTGREELTLVLLVADGALTYGVAVMVLFGRRWLTTLIR
jgi:putative peptidoglycan lipid II flippase